jgi:hypothetical protein
VSEEIAVPDGVTTIRARAVAYGDHLGVELSPSPRTVLLRVCGRPNVASIHVEDGEARCGAAADERGPVVTMYAPAGARVRVVCGE